MNKTKEQIFWFQVNRAITDLFKSHLFSLEDLKYKHDKKFEELEKTLPNESYIIRMANYLDDEDMSRMRKRILDDGNDCKRKIEEAAKSCGILEKE